MTTNNSTSPKPMWHGDTTYPQKMLAIMNRRRSDLLEGGTAPSQADAMAIRHAQHAGWYRTAKGWKQLGPDVRSKVNVRNAEKQPDGRFLIEGVDVFYPNSVKPILQPNFSKGRMEEAGTQQFSSDDIKRISRNTNQAIKAGGQKPGLTRGHPTPSQRDRGVSLPSHGSGINFRESPRGKGWARCDLVDVDPKLVEEWRNRHFTGLSAGFVQDAAGLNQRFGHIAALGGESQALSHLPVTEVFSVSDQLCFSADVGTFIKTLNRSGDHMSMKEKAAQMKDSHNKMSAAYGAVESGDPAAADKLKEAHAAHQSTWGGMEPETMEDGCVMPMEKAGDTPEAPKPAESAGMYNATAMANFEADPVAAFRADPEAAFSAISAKLQTTSTQLQTTIKSQNSLTVENAALKGKLMRTDFENEVGKLKAAGHVFDATAFGEMFSAAKGDHKMIESMYKLMRSSPKQAAIADAPAVFSATDASRPAADTLTDVQKEVDEMNRRYPGQNFTAADVEIGGGFMFGDDRK